MPAGIRRGKTSGKGMDVDAGRFAVDLNKIWVRDIAPPKKLKVDVEICAFSVLVAS